MIELGKKQVLKVIRKKEFGVYVGCEGEDTGVLLPRKYVSEDVKTGDEIEVFVYRDSSDRMIATTLEPLVTLGETAVLKVKDVGKIGAFLDWGLEKDLFLPFKETLTHLQPGDDCLVALYVDKSKRLAATMKVYDYLKTGSSYEKDDRVEGVIYQINERVGTFVAVDGIYHGMIPAQGFHSAKNVGDKVTARVVKVREDGKLELALGDRMNEQMDQDAQVILEALEGYDGVLPFTEKASPAVIERELHMSKAAFKRGIGRLLKKKQIVIEEGKIRLKI